MNSMVISLDTNIWIFGIVAGEVYSERIMINLANLDVIIPNQIRTELERNLIEQDTKTFYRLVSTSDTVIDYEQVPQNLIAEFKEKGLKKGDAQIGAFCQWRNIDVLVSDNRDFLRGLAPDHDFQVMSPERFCEQFLP